MGVLIHYSWSFVDPGAPGCIERVATAGAELRGLGEDLDPAGVAEVCAGLGLDLVRSCDGWWWLHCARCQEWGHRCRRWERHLRCAVDGGIAVPRGGPGVVIAGGDWRVQVTVRPNSRSASVAAAPANAQYASPATT